MWPFSKIHEVGKIIAVVGVLVFLIFVGYEVQQNKETNIQTSTQTLISDYARIVSFLPHNDRPREALRMYNRLAV